MRRLLPAALTLAALAAPQPAAAAVDYRCAATAVSGTVLGQALPVPTAGSVTEPCADASTLPTLALPGPLQPLLSVNGVNGITQVTDQGVFAAGGLAGVKLGTIPIPLPALPDIAIPTELTNINLTLPGLLPVAADDITVHVDLTPAVTAALQALNTRESKSLLDLGVAYATASGTCTSGAPVVGGAARTADASVLGLPLNLDQVTNQALNLVDTSNLDLTALNFDLANVSATVAGVTVSLSSADLAAVVAQVQDQLPALPPVAIPAQLAQLKVTPPSQETADGAILQRGPRVQLSLAGTSLADVTIGAAYVSAAGNCNAEQAAQEAVSQATLECTTRKLALIDVLRRGDHVRLFGAADKSLAGKVVKIVFQATGRTVASVRVDKSGAFTTTAPLPRRSIRGTNRARYIAKVGGEKSLNLKLQRRMTVDSIDSHGDNVTIKGRVIRPLAKPVAPITLKRRVTCKTLETVKTFRPRRDGSFSVTVKKPANLAATVYRLQTRVRRLTTSTKTSPTFTLPRAVDL